MVIDLTNIQWKEFPLKNIFELCLSLGDNQAKLLPEGKMPLVSAGTSNNAICKFIKHGDGKSQLFPPNVITVDMFGKVFYQPTQFYAVSHGRINILIPKIRFNKFIGIFIAQILENRFRNKFSYSIMCNQNRLLKEKIMLPVNSKGEPDYKFMEEYIKEREVKLKNQYRELINLRVKKLQTKINTNKKWGEFKVKDIFPIMVAGKSKGLNHLEQVLNGGISYLGATNRNNGVLCFVEKNGNEKLVQKGNCIAFIRNGEGSMGYSVYKAEDFISTSDITLGYNNKINRYSGMFITTIADRVRGKYSFNYKRSDTRLKEEILSLPINPKGKPDYKFMENYMKHLEQKKILEYLNYIK